MDELDLQHHVDREALVIQLRALATAVEKLAEAVEALAPDDVPVEVSNALDEVRWKLQEIW